MAYGKRGELEGNWDGRDPLQSSLPLFSLFFFSALIFPREQLGSTPIYIILP
jgi:hypothetical protein